MHFNGVDLPPGTIVVELSDGGWVAGRLSAFSLDDEHGAVALLLALFDKVCQCSVALRNGVSMQIKPSLNGQSALFEPLELL